MADLQAKDLKLIQYLNEAYGKEEQLVTALQAHIAMNTRTPYKKRLQRHLRETRAHSRDVKRRIKELGGKAEAVDVPGPDAVTEAATSAFELARKGVAAMQGPLHALRGTGEAEKLLRNAKTEFKEEAEEIALYTTIETLALTVHDRDTAQLAKRIRREEERMRDYLAKQLATLTKAVATEEIPAAERRNSSGRRRASGSRSSGSARKSSSSRSSSSRSRSSASKKSSGSTRSRGGAKRSTSSRSSGSTRSRSTTSKSGGSGRSRSSASKSGGSGRSRSSASKTSGSGRSRSSASKTSGSGRSRASGSTRSRSSASKSGGSASRSRGGAKRSGSSKSGGSRARARKSR